MKPYYEDGSVTIYHGDCREILPDLGGFDAIITDPPYSSGGFQEAGKAGGSVGTRGDELLFLDTLSTRGYERLMREVLRFCREANEIYMFTDWRMWINTFDAIESAGWCVRNMLVWDKMRPGMGRPWRNQHELIAFGLKRSTDVTRAQGNVLREDRTGNIHHPTEKPVQIVSALIAQSAGRCFLDPFMGSGTTLRAAKDSGRCAIGIEGEERYCEIAARRCAQEVLDLEAA